MKQKFPGASSYRDSRGKIRWRYRKGKFAVGLGTRYGSPEFTERYNAAVIGAKAIGPRPAPGSFNDLVARYYIDRKFLKLKPATKRAYRGIIEPLRERFGRLPVAKIDAHNIRLLHREKAATPIAANKRLTVLKMLMRFAVLERMRRDNPAAEVERYEIRSEGYPTWSEEQLARYLDHHPPGSDARLSALIMVWTGAAIGDVWAMGWHNIVSDRLVYRRAKTGNEVTLPLSGMPELVAALPRDRLLFIHSPRGIPYASPDSLGHAFKRWCKRARVPEVSAHGLRKLFATRHANAGANELEIRALLGDHKTDEALKYTRAASRARAADRSFDRLKGEQKTANTPEMLATRGRQPNGKKG